MSKNKIEIMAPAGSYESLQAAIKAGADSVYFGIEQLNMRARAADNFTTEDLKKIVKICKDKSAELGRKIKTYLTVNVVLYDEDLELMKKIIDTAKEAGVKAIIACDLAVIRYANAAGMEIHLSTQANVSNIEAVKFYSHFADVVVLARELNIRQIKNICEEIKKQKIKGPSGNLVCIELFVHGALCVSISGKCYMSLAQYNFSANRGACLQSCRRAYRIIDEETGDELKIDNKYIMSPKDLCTIGMIDKIIEAGVTVFKIEGRGRSPDYVYKVVKVYREAADEGLAGTYHQDKEKKVKAWTKELEKVFNRGFWQNGYYLGKKLGEWSGVYGSKATKEKVFAGTVKNYFQKSGIAEIYLEAEDISVGDEIMITGPTTGVAEAKVESIFVDREKSDKIKGREQSKQIKEAKKGQNITIPIAEKLRKNDKVYLVKNRKE